MSGVDTPMKLLSLELDSMTESTSEELDDKMVVDENVHDENCAPEMPSSDVITDLPLSSAAKRNLTAVFDEVEGQGELSEDESLPEEMEDKENAPPVQQTEKILIKEPEPETFPAPVIEVPEEPKENRILSPKKGVKVNTANTPSYMRGTTSSSAKTPKKGVLSKVPPTADKKREMAKPGFSSKMSKPVSKYGISASLSKKTVEAAPSTSAGPSSRFGFQAPKKLVSRTGSAPAKSVASKPPTTKIDAAAQKPASKPAFSAPKRPLSATSRPAFGSAKAASRPAVGVKPTVSAKSSSSARPASAKPTVSRVKSTLSTATRPQSAVPASRVKSSIPPRPSSVSAKPRPVSTVNRYGAATKPAAAKKEELKKLKPTSKASAKPEIKSKVSRMAPAAKKEVQKVKPAVAMPAATVKSKPEMPKPKIEATGPKKLTSKAAEVTERLNKTPKTPREKVVDSKTPKAQKTPASTMGAKTPVASSRPKTPVAAKTPVASRTPVAAKSARTPGATSKTPVGASKSAKNDAKKRRRTRFSITKEASDKMSEAFSKCGKNKVKVNDSLFKDLNEADYFDAQSALVVQAIDDLVKSAKEQNLPSQIFLDLLIDIRQDLGADIDMVLGFWTAKIGVMMRLGSKASEIEEELEKASAARPIPASEFEKFKAETLEKIKEEGFDERGVSPDPEATIALEDDEMLELSIVNMPPFEEDAFNQNQVPEISVQAPTPEPESTEQTLANMTEYNNKSDTLLRFVIRKTKLKDNSKIVVTPVRRSKRIADKTPSRTPGLTPKVDRTPHAEVDSCLPFMSQFQRQNSS